MQVLSERTVAEVGDEAVTVRKAALDLARENVVGIKLSIRSKVDEPVTVRLVEEFPGHVSMSDIQAHPSYYPERWTVSEGRRRMTFETPVRPDRTVETLYGVRVTDGDLEPFIGEPSVESQTESRASPDTGSTPADDDQPADGADESAATESDASFEFGDERSEAADADETTPAAGDSSPAATVDAHIEAIARTELSADQQERLREAIGVAPAESEQIQLSNLQASVSRLSAFADEFERFVDAVGAPGDVIDELRAANERLAVRVDALDDTVRSVAEERTDQGDEIQQLADRVDALDDAVRSVTEERTDHGDEIQRLADRVDDLDETVRSAAESRSHHGDTIRRLVDQVADLDDTVRSMAAEREDRRSRIEQLEADQASLRDDLSSAVGGLEDRLDADLVTEFESLEDRVEELEEVLGAEEFEGIREVVAAERAWRRRLEASRAGRTPARAPGDAGR